MHLKRLELINYRNYDKVSFNFSPHLNLIIGRNAQGKTNILEAIHFLSFGQSHRSQRDRELIKFDQTYSAIKGVVEGKKKGEFTLEVFLSADEGKKIKINGIERQKNSELLGNLQVVMFSPDDLSIIKGSPEQRRLFLDMTISQINPVYYHWRKQYERVLRQRNTLLRDLAALGSLEGLSLWDRKLIEAGSELILGRINIVRSLQGRIKSIYERITGGEDLKLSYISSFCDGSESEILEIAKKFERELARRRKEELEREITLVGPHRDDLLFLLNGVDARFFGSQGEQRTIALALKLAQFNLIKDVLKDTPVLLLDDIMSELDEGRRKEIIQLVENKTQVLITSTSEKAFKLTNLREKKVIQVDRERVSNEGSD